MYSCTQETIWVGGDKAMYWVKIEKNCSYLCEEQKSKWLNIKYLPKFTLNICGSSKI